MMSIRKLFLDFRRRKWMFTKRELCLEILKGMALSGLVSYLFFNRIWLMLFMIPGLYPWLDHQEKKKRERQRESVLLEFKEMMLSVNNSLFAGYSLENAVIAALEDLNVYHGNTKSILELELEKVVSRLKVNQPLEEALQFFAEALNVDEITEFVQVIAIINRNGGNVIEIIGKTVEHLNTKLQVKEEIITLTSAKRLEQKIMSLMPYLILMYVRLTNPGYFYVIYNNAIGLIFSGFCVAVIILSDWWAQKIIRIEV